MNYEPFNLIPVVMTIAHILDKFCKKRYKSSLLDALSNQTQLIEQLSMTPSILLIPGDQAAVTADTTDYQIEQPRDERQPDDTPQCTGELSAPFLDFLNILQQNIAQQTVVIDTYGSLSRFSNACKFVYNNFGLHYMILLLILIAYALLGGLLFYHLEAPVERLYIRQFQQNAQARRFKYAASIMGLLSMQTCNSSALTQAAFNISDASSCIGAIITLMHSYDQKAGIKPFSANQWNWDNYWNAVFYCGTIFTTIGYGNISCRSKEGRLATIFYTLIGVPYLLFVLDSFGKIIYERVQTIWLFCRKRVRNSKICAYLKRQSRKATITNLNSRQTEKSDREHTDELFETFPLYLAFILVFSYIGICSVFVCLWEKWDYFTAFYFFFISLTTVGLGDEIPDQPHYACMFFAFFIIGMALVSMCISIMQMRVENKYMAALELIERQRWLVTHVRSDFSGDPAQNSGSTEDRQLVINPILLFSGLLNTAITLRPVAQHSANVFDETHSQNKLYYLDQDDDHPLQRTIIQVNADCRETTQINRETGTGD